MSNLTFDIKCVRANPQSGICEMDTVGGGSNVPPETFFSLPLSIPAIMGVANFPSAEILTGGFPTYLFHAIGGMITLNNVYAPPVPGLLLRIPLRRISGDSTTEIEINVNGVTTTVFPLAATMNFDISLAGVTNPITITLTLIAGGGSSPFAGGFDPVIFAP